MGELDIDFRAITTQATGGAHTGRAALWEWGGSAGDGGLCHHGSDAGGCVTMVQLVGQEPLFTVQSQPLAESAAPVAVLHVLSPECADGWVFLGELSKFATHSGRRFGGATSSGYCRGAVARGGLHARVVGSVGEVIQVTAISPARKVVVKTVKILPREGGVAVVLDFP